MENRKRRRQSRGGGMMQTSIEAMKTLIRSAEDAKLVAKARLEGHADGHTAGFSEGWEAGNDVAAAGMAVQER